MDLAGVLNLTNVDQTANQVGQRIVYDAIQTLVDAYNAEMAKALNTLVAGPLPVYKEIYKMPGGGTLEEMGIGAPLATPAAMKVTGELDVAYDLRDARTQIAWDDVTIAKMSIADLNTQIQSVMIKHQNWDVSWLLTHLFNNANDTFADPVKGSLTIRRLANLDGTIYAPKFGQVTGGVDDDHYLFSGYAPGAISDVNNPYATLYKEVTEHEGPTQAMLYFVNEAQIAKTEALTGFVETSDPYVTQAISGEYLKSVLDGVPGVCIGRMKNLGWVINWNRIPENYILAVRGDASGKVLQARVDEEEELRGFRLLPGFKPESPLEGSVWRDRKGYGVKNRTAAAVMFVDAGAGYAIPTEFNKV